MPSSSKSSKTKTEGEKPAKPKPAKREPGIYISEKDKADIIYSTIGGKHYELRKALEKVASRSNEGRKSGASDVIVPGHVLKYIELGENEVLYHDLERWLSKKYPGSKMLPPGLINLFALACLCDDLRGNYLIEHSPHHQPFPELTTEPSSGNDHRYDRDL